MSRRRNEYAPLLDTDSEDASNLSSAVLEGEDELLLHLGKIDLSWVSDLTLVLVGNTGVGKSATGNLILGQKEFISKSSAECVTTETQRVDGLVEGRRSTVIDTPGLFDSTMDKKSLRKEIEKCLESIPEPYGLHAILLVISVGGRFTQEDKDTVSWIQENFGEESLKYTVVVFTKADLLYGTELDKYIQSSPALAEVVRNCGGRKLKVNSLNMRDRTQVTKLLGIIDQMVQGNEGRMYTNETFSKVQKKIKRHEQLKDVALATGSAVGTVGMVAGGVVLGVTEMVVLPAVVVAAGGAVALGAGINLAVNKFKSSKKKKMKPKNETQVNESESTHEEYK